jgi:hypothetical protein
LQGQRIVLWYDIARLRQQAQAEFERVSAGIKKTLTLPLLFGTDAFIPKPSCA